MSETVAFVLKGYPRLSETFIAQEIHGLERAGLDIRIISLRHPTDQDSHPVHNDIRAPVNYLPEYLFREPLRVWRGWRRTRLLPGYRKARRTWLRDLARDPTPNRIRRFGQAMVLAGELPREVSRLHAHFIHTPASVARYCAIARDLPWSCSAHARDIWTTPGWELSDKLADCDWATACSGAARDSLAAHLPGGPDGTGPEETPDKLHLIYHGLDFARFPPFAGQRPARDGSDPNHPVIILSVGRAVEKKGHDVLIRALARLPAGLHWRLVHVGGGALRSRLKRQAKRAGISGLIDWMGALPQNRVLDHYRAADLFVLASRVAGDGDRDGLPNVLMEAQSQGLSCLSTRVSAVPELIDDGVTGTLVAPGDDDALAGELEALITDPARRGELGIAGARRVRSAFSCAAGTAALATRFGLDPPARDDPATAGPGSGAGEITEKARAAGV